MLVTVAIILKEGKILIAKRGDKWEFPGGRVEEGESMEECIMREIKEEMGIDIEIIEKFCTEKDNDIELHVFLARYKNGEIHLNFHNDAKWILIKEAGNYEFLPLDKRVMNKLEEKWK